MLAEPGEDLSLSAMHSGRHGVEFRAGRLNEDNSPVSQRASGRRAGRESSVEVDGLHDWRARDLVDRRSHIVRHVVPR